MYMYETYHCKQHENALNYHGGEGTRLVRVPRDYSNEIVEEEVSSFRWQDREGLQDAVQRVQSVLLQEKKKKIYTLIFFHLNYWDMEFLNLFLGTILCPSVRK